MSELVSIITPSYNTAGFIADTIESVLAQTYTNWEMIIVDDCSSDNTDEVVRPYLQDGRIRYLKNPKNSGAAISRNYALREAKGRWISFLDSDDLWEPTKLEKQIKFMEDNGYHFSYHAYEPMSEDSIPSGTKVSGPKRINKRQMYNFCWMGCLSVMYDADVVGLIQIEDLKKNNDYAIWLRAVEKADCYFMDECLARYRLRSGSISRHSKFKLIKHHYLLYRKGENKSSLAASLLTARNLFWGVYKKFVYVKSK